MTNHRGGALANTVDQTGPRLDFVSMSSPGTADPHEIDPSATPAAVVRPRSTAVRRLTIALAAFAVLGPFLYYLARGVLTSPLWLDEIAYHYWESDLTLRAEEIGRPRSIATDLLTNYVYGSLQAGVRHLADLVGIRFAAHPETVLRALSVLSFLGAVGLTFWRALRRGPGVPTAAVAAGLIAAPPLLLYFAFEGRGYMFACLVTVALLALLETALPAANGGSAPPLPAAKLASLVLLSLVLAQSHHWTACLLAGLALVGASRTASQSSTRDERLAWAAASLPGLAALGLQFIYLSATDPNLPQFPFLAPVPRSLMVAKALAAPAYLRVHGVATPQWTMLLATLGGSALMALTAVALWRRAQRREGWLLLAATFGLLSSCVLGVLWGNLIPVRHQSYLFAALLFAFGACQGRLVRWGGGIFIFAHLLLLPAGAAVALGRSNGQSIAELYRTAGAVAPIVVQHPTHFGYPDPLLSFPADFYINQVGISGRPPVPILELPELRQVTGLRVLSPTYLWGGDELLRRYRAAPTETWQQWLNTPELKQFWFLFPAAHIEVDSAISTRFVSEARAAGFAPDPQWRGRLVASPPGLMLLFARRSPANEGD